MDSIAVFKFRKNADLSDWSIVGDSVMGGNSLGRFKLNTKGNGLFSGHISVENNGGFSSVRYGLEPILLSGDEILHIKLKGDGKDYKVQIKQNSRQNYSYTYAFSTNGQWQDLKIPLKSMYPTFRGKLMDQPNFNHPQLEEFALLIAYQKNEGFALEIKSIELKRSVEHS